MLEVTMEVNSKIMVLNHFVMNMVMTIIFLLIELLNKMRLLNRTLKEMARTILCENNLQKYF